MRCLFASCRSKVVLNGNRTEWNPIGSVITDRIEHPKSYYVKSIKKITISENVPIFLLLIGQRLGCDWLVNSTFRFCCQIKEQ